MRKTLLLTFLLTVASQALAEKFDNIALSVGGQYSRRLSGNPGHENALGGTLSFEWMPAPELAIGLGGNLDCYFGAAPTTTDPSFASAFDLRGRLLPWGVSQGTSPFLIGGAGLNPKVGQGAWAGTFHAFAGAGTWVTLSPRLALDLSATYDLFTPLDSPLQNLNLRLGFTFFSEELAPPAARSRTLVAPGPTPTQGPGAMDPTPKKKKKKKVRKVQAGSLWDLAARPDVYGDPELYPILVDANFSKLTGPGVIGSIPLAKGAKLTIPSDLTEENIRVARQNAWKETYTRWRGKDVTPEDYRKWKAANPKGATRP